MQFSPSTLSFYPTEIDYGSNLPSDVRDVSMEVFNAIINAPSDKVRAADAEGNPILADAPIPPPVQVTRISRAQGKKQLIAADMFTLAKNAVDDPAKPEQWRIGFYDEAYWNLDDEFVLAVAKALTITKVQLEAMFTAASLL